MTVVMGRGECGSHVTLIFTVNDDDDEIINQGSLGVGFCLEKGVETIARGIEGKFKIDIKLKSKVINCCNGGRYDKLISDLGAKKQTPAVGAALNLIY